MNRVISAPDSKVTAAFGTTQEVVNEVESVGANRIISVVLDPVTNTGYVIYGT